MTFRALSSAALALTLIAILSFGSLAHAFLPHQHSANEAVTNLLHSALHHESKKLIDAVPMAPVFLAVVVALIGSPTYARRFFVRGFLIAPPLHALLRRGVLPYRRFG